MMKIKIAMSILLASLMALADTVINASSRYQIVIPDEYPLNTGIEYHLKELGNELRTAFKGTLGLDVPVVRESAKGDCRSIYLGATQAIAALGINTAKFKDFNGIIAEQDGDLYLAGNDHHRFSVQKPDKSYRQYILGTVKAAVFFMEQYMDACFIAPGPAGADYAPLASVRIPSGLRREVVSTLVFASGRNQKMIYDYSNQNFGAGAFYSYGGHSYYSACPGNVYGKEHPEYFALLGGVRNSTEGHLCISNPAVQELIYQEALKRLDAGAETVQVAQTDGYQPCQCDACKAFGGTYDQGEKIWILHRMFAERLLKDRPGKNLHLLCYPPCSEPPKSFDAFPDNVIIELCKYTPEVFEQWKRIRVKQGFTVYIYNWGWYQYVGITPKTTPEFCSRQAKLFVENNVRGIYRCGFGELFGLEGPSYYVFGKTLENPMLDCKELTDKYLRRTFGKASVPMRSFFNLLYTRLEQMYLNPMMHKGLQTQVPTLPESRLVTLGALYSPDLLAAMEKYLSQAEKMAGNDIIRHRLDVVRREFDYLKSLGFPIAHYNSYLASPSQETFKLLANSIKARNALIDSYYQNGKQIMSLAQYGGIPFLGGITKNVLLVNGRLHAPVAAPFTWAVDNLLEKGILPGTSSKSMIVKRAHGNIGDNPEENAWKAAPWQEVLGIQMNATWSKARFKAIYDDTGIHFAFETTVKPGIVYQPLGHDGGCWNQDSIEIMLDTEAARTRYFHFIFNPIPDSYFDANFGFITDPLHPKYRDANALWNAEWSYKGVIKDDLWTSFATIPFASLGVKTPTSGTSWCMNIGREAHIPLPPDDKGRQRSELSLMLWSPNMENMSFQSPEAFGHIVFE